LSSIRDSGIDLAFASEVNIPIAILANYRSGKRCIPQHSAMKELDPAVAFLFKTESERDAQGLNEGVFGMTHISLKEGGKLTEEMV
jgi:methylphosphotriester-DNA--protein-cysteine methyltransferase